MPAGSGTTALQFILSLNDRVTGPMGRVLRTVQGQAQRMSASVTAATARMQSGFLLGAGGALGLAAALRPAIAMSKALGEVRSLGVAEDALKLLGRESMRFTSRFGGNASEVVRSAYDIQSAIAGLKGDELARFTIAGNITAKATKSSAQEITGYFGTMYGIFEKQATAMGKAKWVDMLAGQTSQAVQMFKTTGPQMSRAFTGLGASATAMGVTMSEQFAVLGTLQATMPGPEAGTKYRALLAGLGKAQQAFGLRFTDSSGKLKALPEILDLIRPKLAGLDAVAQQDLLLKALGSQEAVGVVQLLVGQTAQLQRNIGALGRVRGLGPAVAMAEAMVTPWDRFTAGVYNLAVMLGQVLLPIVNPVIASLTRGAETLQTWAEVFPNLTRLVGLGVLSIFALALGLGVLKIGFGALSLVLLPLKALLIGAKVALWLFNAALWANPALWILVGFLALGVAIMLAIKHWDTLKKWLGEFWGWLKTSAGNAVDKMMGTFARWWDDLKVGFRVVVDTVVGYFAALPGKIRGVLADMIGPGTVLGKLLGKVGIDVSSFFPTAGKPAPGTLPELSPFIARPGAAAEREEGLSPYITRLPPGEHISGETRQAITNLANSDNSRRVQIGQMTIHPKEEVGPDYLSRTILGEVMG